jgi:multidrug efflux pump subunit AcrA (membrane-fusion protein)
MLTFFLMSISLISCSKRNDDENDLKPRAIVKVASASIGDIDDRLSVTGSFEVLRDEKVKSPISGRVEKIFVLEGDAVRKSEIIATIISQESYAAIAGANQLLNEATTSGEKQQAEQALRLAEKTATSANVTSPFSGAVIHRYVSEGEIVSQGTDLIEIIDPSTEYFIASVPIRYISSVRPGQIALVTIPGMDVSPLPGHVQAINPSTDPTSQSVQVRIGLAHIPSHVAPGTFGDVQIKIDEHKSTVLVPRKAVYHDDELDKYFVWKIQGDTLALMTQVSIGLSDSLHVEILSGIKPGDAVAIEGGYGLPDSTLVTVSSN